MPRKREKAKTGTSKAKPIPPGLIPAKPGEVRNPKGNNQYTYRRDFERSFAGMMSGTFPKKMRDTLPKSVQETLPENATTSEALLYVVIQGAATDPKVMADVLKRLFPATELHGSDPEKPMRVEHTTKLPQERQAEVTRLVQGLLGGSE